VNILLVVLIILAGLAAAFAWASRCPKCRQFLALNFTDNYRQVNKLGVQVKQREVLCKKCGHRFWREHRDSNTGAGD
jgi:uncharacterized protein with PIN domain